VPAEPAIALTIPLLLVLIILLDRITPVELTRNDIARTLSRIDLYAKQHGSLPSSLDGLPKEEGSFNKTTDDWGRRLLYDINSDLTITLASLCADGRPGGWRKPTPGRALRRRRTWVSAIRRAAR